MQKIVFILITILLCSTPAVADDNGLISTKSAYSVETTADRLEHALLAKGMTVFARINHAEGAKKIGKSLRSTEVIIFGNPKIGTRLMQCAQSVAIDLPQKALIWEDASAQVWLTYNAPEYLLKRHGIKGCDKVIHKITNALSNFAKAATAE